MSLVPVRITGLAPSVLATATAISPIGPGPVTTSDCPANNPPSVSRPYIAVPAVTINVASSSVTLSPTWHNVFTLLITYSANPPSVVNPFALCPLSCPS